MFGKYKFILTLSAFCFIACIIQSCSTTRHVSEGKYLLVNAKVESDTKDITSYEMETYIRQKPNFKTFTIFKLPLTIYNLSGKDTTKWINRTLRKAGDPPVIFDSLMVGRTAVDLKRMMTNKGYLESEINPIVKLHNKKANVTYQIKASKPYTITNYKINVDDSVITKLKVSDFPKRVMKDYKVDSTFLSSIDSIIGKGTIIKEGSLFDLNMLDSERERINKLLHRIGFFTFNKEFIGFVVDTAVGNKKVDLELKIYPYLQQGKSEQTPHKQFRVKEVSMYIDYNPVMDGAISGYQTTSEYKKDGFKIMYGPRGEYIKPEILINSCYIVPGGLYHEGQVEQTYNSLAQLQILKNVNINFTSDSTDLKCIITCVPNKKQGIATELDGTNSGKGFFGVGASVGYSHRNAFNGSELFNIKTRGAYEAITPDFTKFKDNYFEIGGETSLSFPRFLFPFVTHDFKRRMNATTQVRADYTFQRRPGFFTRTVLSSGVKYIWQDRRKPLKRHAFDLIDISYVHIPKTSLNQSFTDKLTDAARRYSFTDQFIFSTGYSYSNTNMNNANDRKRKSIYSFRLNVESAGNSLAVIAKVFDLPKDEGGSREIFGTKFAQYLRGTFDYSKVYNLDEKNSFAWRIGSGIAYPYGNFKEIPIQKRFFSGGANSVRGWSIRDLGPGGFAAPDSLNNFFYHSGDIRFDANIEYRSKIFWVIELAAFIDTGNIWRLGKYENQDKGDFQFNRFYREIAASWGLGIRLDFDYVLIRLDAGWKMYDPSSNPNRPKWPIKYPFDLRHNAAAHIAIGYPF